MKSLSAAKFKATCLALMDEVNATGEPIVVTKRGVPLVQLIPFVQPAPQRHRLGGMRDQIKILGDVLSPAVDPEEWEVLR